MLPPDEAKALRLLTGLAKFTWLKRLKNSARNSTFFDSLIGKRLITEKSTFVCRGPRKTLRPTLPKSVPVALAVAVPVEVGIQFSARKVCPAKTNGLE